MGGKLESLDQIQWPTFWNLVTKLSKPRNKFENLEIEFVIRSKWIHLFWFVWVVKGMANSQGHGKWWLAWNTIVWICCFAQHKSTSKKKKNLSNHFTLKPWAHLTLHILQFTRHVIKKWPTWFPMWCGDWCMLMIKFNTNFWFTKETLKDCLHNTLKELKTWKSNEERSNIATF